MSDISFERLSILLAEDNPYIRSLLTQILKDLGFGKVHVAKNGQDAIEMLDASKASGVLRSSSQVDIVMSDLLMTPIDGELLLRWIRTSKQSPNRFLPFIMVSGAADRDRVSNSRDFGVTEFLAKPFSAKTVYERIMKAIVAPRQFICTNTYFGPDRRRLKWGPPDGVERRSGDEEKATIVYSSDKVVKPAKDSDIWLFRLPNNLKEKIGGLNVKGTLQLPKELLEQAEQSLERQALDFTEWAKNYLKEMSVTLEKAREQKDKRLHYIHEINMVAHELRGQGGTFGYPLVTILGKSLYDATCGDCRDDDNGLDIIKAHIDAIRAVIRDKVSGDGGKIGRLLLEGLRAAIEKYSKVA